MIGPLREALSALRRGEFVVVVDDADREDEGDLVIAAHAVTPERIRFLLRHTAGVVCAPMSAHRADALGLPPMVEHNTEPHRTAFTVTVDAAHGVGTGISATDRATTLRTLADPRTTPAGLVRPGHVFPLRAVDGGVLARRGHTEAAVDLARLAGLPPVMAICELTEDGELMRGPAIETFAHRYGLVRLTVQDVVDQLCPGRLQRPAV